MANFKTPYPVDLESLKQLLPPGAYVDPVIKWNAEAQRAEVHWASNLLKSPYQFPIEFTVDQLLARELPQHTTIAQTAPKPPQLEWGENETKAYQKAASDVADFWKPVTSACAEDQHDAKLAKARQNEPTVPFDEPETKTTSDIPVAVIVTEKPVDVRKARGKNKTA